MGVALRDKGDSSLFFVFFFFLPADFNTKHRTNKPEFIKGIPETFKPHHTTKNSREH
jgi:hypothetical protein